MKYHFCATVNKSFSEAVEVTKSALRQHGFRVLTEIDMQANLQNSLNIDFRPYVILGVCKPKEAHRALAVEDKLGVLLPCNVIVQQFDEGDVEVAAIDPVSAMGAVDHIVVAQVARDIRDDLRHVISDVGHNAQAA